LRKIFECALDHLEQGCPKRGPWARFTWPLALVSECLAKARTHQSLDYASALERRRFLLLRRIPLFVDVLRRYMMSMKSITKESPSNRKRKSLDRT